MEKTFFALRIRKMLVCMIFPLIAMSFLPKISFGGEGVDSNYFDRSPATKGNLWTVEKYHLSKNTFWKHYQMGHYGNAVKELKFVLRYFPNHPKALMLLGMVSKMQQKPFIAESYYKRALSLYPQNAITHAQFGSFLVEIGKTSEGIEKLKQAIEMDPELTFGYVALERAYKQLGSPKLALEMTKRIKELKEETTDYQFFPEIKD